MIKLRFCCRIIPGRGKEESEQGGELNHRGRLGGAEKGGNVGDGCVVELLQPMWGWHTGYPHLQVVKERWLLGFMIG